VDGLARKSSTATATFELEISGFELNQFAPTSTGNANCPDSG
jgi:hypothetical protein